MNDCFQLFQYPFMQRAFIVGVVLGALLAYLGVFVVLRRMAFFADGIAQVKVPGLLLMIPLLSVTLPDCAAGKGSQFEPSSMYSTLTLVTVPNVVQLIVELFEAKRTSEALIPGEVPERVKSPCTLIGAASVKTLESLAS